MQENELNEFNGIHYEMNAIYREIAVKIGLSDSGFAILYVMATSEEDLVTQKTIAQSYGISKQTINSSIRKLESEGILRLEEHCTKNRKLFLTEKGKRFVADKIMPIVAAEMYALQKMSKEERDLFLRLSKKHMQMTREAFLEI